MFGKYDDEWTEKYETKKEIFGKFIVRVGGQTDCKELTESAEEKKARAKDTMDTPLGIPNHSHGVMADNAVCRGYVHP